ncbi:MAG: hypothetical protein U0263_10795 [Polyangiaceae bacterium]
MRRWAFCSSACGPLARGLRGQAESGGTGGASGSGGGGAVSGSGGTSGGGTGGTGTGGVSTGGVSGSGGAPCSVLDTTYAATLVQAKVCNPALDMEQCTAKVPDALACPCAFTFVNAGNASALNSLTELSAQWSLQKCSEGIDCPAIACEAPALGSCKADATTGSGSCQDMFTNQ